MGQGASQTNQDNVQVWSLDSKTRIASFQGRGEVLSARFVPEGLRILTQDASTVSPGEKGR